MSASDPLHDEPQPRAVHDRRLRVQGAKWDVVTDRVQLDDDTAVDRDVVLHRGAVGVVALDDDEQVVLVRQYRHPVASMLWEIPAGLLDDPGETPFQTAVRELVEEAGLRASRWDTVIDLYSSPGMSSETLRVFLARGLSDVSPDERPVPTDEEREMVVRRFPLDAVVGQIGQGRLHNALAVSGILATDHARRQGWRGLRPVDEPWPGPDWGLG